MSKVFQETRRVAPDVLERYEPIIGLEVHVQLKTATKIFCACSTRFGDPPNTNVCPVCLGLPGSLPVLNRRALEMAIRAALALHCTVHERSRFARKNYFYPDLPKGYQISMYELPLASSGWLEILPTMRDAVTQKRVGITRLHLEEDAAKALHEGFPDSDRSSYIDYNRCGVPLIEIVSEPDLRSPAEAYTYLNTLKQVLQYTGVSDCNMEEGSLRCDANVSVRCRGAQEFGTKTEVKNLNSFRYLQRALEYEIERHIGVLEAGGQVEQETRLWNLAGRTEPMRSKEYAHDYRYFPEPDLLPVRVSPAGTAEIVSSMPELPEARRARFLREYGITPYDAGVLTDTRELADYFEAVVKAGAPPKLAANWIQTELLHRLKESGKEISQSPIKPAELADLLRLVETGKITTTSGKKLLEKIFELVLAGLGLGVDVITLAAAEGLEKISDASEIERICRDVIEKHPDKERTYRLGNKNILKFFIGEVMRATRGRASADTASAITSKELKYRHERAVAESFFARYNETNGVAYTFTRFGSPPEPDLFYIEANSGKDLGVEITSTYLDREEARFVSDLARNKLGAQQAWSSRVIGEPDERYKQLLFGAVLNKLQKNYSGKAPWLIVEFNYPLGNTADAERIAGEVRAMLKRERSPFAQVWAVWQVTNQEPARYEIFRLL